MRPAWVCEPEQGKITCEYSPFAEPPATPTDPVSRYVDWVMSQYDRMQSGFDSAFSSGVATEGDRRAVMFIVGEMRNA